MEGGWWWYASQKREGNAVNVPWCDLYISAMDDCCSSERKIVFFVFHCFGQDSIRMMTKLKTTADNSVRR